MHHLNQISYEQDYYAWLIKNAECIRQGSFSEIDIENVAEELESMGRSEKRELISRLTVLMMHLLKWQYQTERRSNIWKYTIMEQRRKVDELLEDSPSLRYELHDRLAYAYETALIKAAKETGMNIKSFPQTCPFSLENIMDKNFWGDM